MRLDPWRCLWRIVDDHSLRDVANELLDTKTPRMRLYDAWGRGVCVNGLLDAIKKCFNYALKAIGRIILFVTLFGSFKLLPSLGQLDPELHLY